MGEIHDTYAENVRSKWPCPEGFKEINPGDEPDTVKDRVKRRDMEFRGWDGDRVRIYDPGSKLEVTENPAWFVQKS